MSHIVIIIDRAPPPTSSMLDSERQSDTCTATVRYAVPHEATDAEVGQAVKKLYRQVRDLGS